MVNVEAHTVRGITQKSSLLNWRFWTQKVWDALKIAKYIFEKVENQEWYFLKEQKKCCALAIVLRILCILFQDPSLGTGLPMVDIGFGLSLLALTGGEGNGPGGLEPCWVSKALLIVRNQTGVGDSPVPPPP